MGREGGLEGKTGLEREALYQMEPNMEGREGEVFGFRFRISLPENK